MIDQVYTFLESFNEFERWVIGICITLLLYFIQPIKSLYRWIWKNTIKRILVFLQRTPTAQKSLAIVSQPSDSYWWDIGDRRGNPVMFIHGHWFVTNLTRSSFNLSTARLIKTGTTVYVDTKNIDSIPNYWGRYDLPPCRQTEFSVEFSLEPPICNPGKDFKSDIIVTDSNGIEHPIKNIVFHFQQ